MIFAESYPGADDRIQSPAPEDQGPGGSDQGSSRNPTESTFFFSFFDDHILDLEPWTSGFFFF